MYKALPSSAMAAMVRALPCSCPAVPPVAANSPVRMLAMVAAKGLASTSSAPRTPASLAYSSAASRTVAFSSGRVAKGGTLRLCTFTFLPTRRPVVPRLVVPDKSPVVPTSDGWLTSVRKQPSPAREASMAATMRYLRVQHAPLHGHTRSATEHGASWQLPGASLVPCDSAGPLGLVW